MCSATGERMTCSAARLSRSGTSAERPRNAPRFGATRTAPKPASRAVRTSAACGRNSSATTRSGSSPTYAGPEATADDGAPPPGAPPRPPPVDAGALGRPRLEGSSLNGGRPAGGARGRPGGGAARDTGCDVMYALRRGKKPGHPTPRRGPRQGARLRPPPCRAWRHWYFLLLRMSDPLLTLREYAKLAPWNIRDLAALAGAVLDASGVS